MTRPPIDSQTTEPELLDAEAWEVPRRLTRDDCRDQTGAEGRRKPRPTDDHDHEDDDR